ncbi:MAG: hypothetical protein R3209_11205 [Salinimicrobium sediminis]|uniref:Uncharacterized protein n=1 Tax=Salinimicrobium sediminis TaxID=1343891 RepID=A0A285X6U1_9FLAO|nr:hypothetical protein [Salinimicrobium sediminis]MDX1603632.1 hypothetical protein [Salinimicrobium sediminis]SOC81063.1 hypothetical protein SAMN06296241_2635 [Salinimicrobium sediminis]
MVVRQKKFGRKELYEAYISQINWDWLFLKGLLIFGGILFIGVLAFLYWFL